jgi:hypothetical protein
MSSGNKLKFFMRGLFSLIVWGVVLLGPAGVLAQEPSAALGYLRFVNATGYDGMLFVKLDGVEISPTGYPSGLATGAVGFAPKECVIEIRHEVLGEVKVSVTLKPGLVSSVIALPLVEEAKPGKPRQTVMAEEKPKVELTHQVLESRPFKAGAAPTLTVLQSTPMKLMELQVGKQALTVEPLKPATLAMQGMGDFPVVMLAGKKVAMLNMTDPADQVVVLFITDKGLVQNVTFSNLVN